MYCFIAYFALLFVDTSIDDFTPRFAKKAKKSPTVNNMSTDLNEVFIKTLSQQQNYMKKKMETPKKATTTASIPETPMTSYFKYMHSFLKQLDTPNRKRVFKKLRLTFED